MMTLTSTELQVLRKVPGYDSSALFEEYDKASGVLIEERFEPRPGRVRQSMDRQVSRLIDRAEERDGVRVFSVT